MSVGPSVIRGFREVFFYGQREAKEEESVTWALLNKPPDTMDRPADVMDRPTDPQTNQWIEKRLDPTLQWGEPGGHI